MNIFEIENALPNGFHDSFIRYFQVSYENLNAEVGLSICMSTSEEEFYLKKPRYQFAKLKLTKLNFFSIENSEILLHETPQGVLVTTGHFQDLPHQLRIKLPKAMHIDSLFWFFVSTWNAFIFVDALEAELLFESS